MTVLKITAKRDRRRAGRRFLKGQPVRIKAGALKKHERAAIEADPALEVFELEPEGAPQDDLSAAQTQASPPPPPEPEAGPAAEETATAPEPEGASAQDQKDAPEASAEAPKPGKGRSGGRRKGAKANKR